METGFNDPLASVMKQMHLDADTLDHVRPTDSKFIRKQINLVVCDVICTRYGLDLDTTENGLYFDSWVLLVSV